MAKSVNLPVSNGQIRKTINTFLKDLLSKKVVEAYGGTIELQEPENAREGAVFRVTLAIASTDIGPH